MLGMNLIPTFGNTSQVAIPGEHPIDRFPDEAEGEVVIPQGLADLGAHLAAASVFAQLAKTSVLGLEEGSPPDVRRCFQDQVFRPECGNEGVTNGLTSGFRDVNENELVPMGNDQEPTYPLKCQDSPMNPMWLSG